MTTEVSDSVIIPAFNAASTIDQTLESLLTQQFTAWEAVVVDDGSSDETVDVVVGVADIDGRIRIARQRRGGAATAAGLLSAFHDEPLALPRIEVRGDRDLAVYISGLGAA